MPDIVEAGKTAMICLYNGDPQTGGINKLRVALFQDKVAKSSLHVDPKSLPPTKDACRFHSLRVYNQIIEWNNLSEGLVVTNYGWKLKNSVLLPVGTEQQPAPENILKMIRCGCKAGCKTVLCGCRKLGLECSGVCQNCKGDCLNSGRPDLTEDS